MANILSRSPYIVTIDQPGQTETKVELFIWNGTGSIPALPTYTLSKIVPSPSQTATHYNVSSYIREFFNFNTFQNLYDTVTPPYYTALNTSQWVNVKIKKWYKTTGAFVEIVEAGQDMAYDGYSLYTDGLNNTAGVARLTPKNYYYLYGDPGLSTQTFLQSNPDYRTGTVSFRAVSTNLVLRYTNLRTNAIVTNNVTTAGNWVIPRVLLDNYADGNLLEIYIPSVLTLFSGKFIPKTECKYTPVVCDFINKWGAWQREYFFKASKSNIEVTNSEYNLYQSTFPNFSTSEGQRKTFNTTYKEKITVNTDWVNEDFADNLRELMTSERILLDNKPVKLNTKSVELQKHINTKMINYTLEFEYANDIINLVV